MSTLAMDLMNKRETGAMDAACLLGAITAERYSDEEREALNSNETLADAIADTMLALDERNLGMLERYVCEEVLLYGRTKEDVAAVIAANADRLVDDLFKSGLRHLRRPEILRPLKDAIR